MCQFFGPFRKSEMYYNWLPLFVNLITIIKVLYIFKNIRINYLHI